MREELGLPPSQSGAVWLHQPRGRLHFWHHHDEFEFNLVVRGTGRYLLDDRRYDLGPGCLVWLFPAQEHLLVEMSMDFQCWIGVIRPAVLKAACGRTHAALLAEDPAGYFCRRLPDADVTDLHRIALDCQTAQSRGDAVFLRTGLAYLFLSAWVRYQATQDTIVGTRVPPAVEKAAAALARGEAHLESIAHDAGLSYGQLSRSFHRAMGQTLVAYRARCRLRRFLALHQRSPARGLLPLALAAGFGSYAQFHRTFSATFGIGPRQWLADGATITAPAS